MNAVSINVDELTWQPALEYPGQAEAKVLSAGGDMTPRTILLSIPPGWRMDRHSHRYTELHYVLEGQYESNGEQFPVGTFRMIPKAVEHGPFATKSGAIILVIWCSLSD
jgi:anti-sigma factor ChrR (cupin superfamily)